MHLVGDAEEERQRIGGCNQEDAGTYDHHDLLLHNLLIAYKYLIINWYLNDKIAKGTNWEQKFQKPQNENICLTNLNVENNGNFPILSFGNYFDNELIESL